MSSVLHRLSGLLLFVSLVSLEIVAGTTGKVAGTVTDAESGETIPYANVILEGTTLGAAANEDGKYVILNIPPGVYTVVASSIGFQKTRVTDVRVSVDFTTTLDLKLQTGDIELPPVVIQGERNPLIRPDLTNPVASITSESFQELPVDQIGEVIALQAGVVVDDDGSIHIRGGYSNEIAYSLNGITLNDPYGNFRSVGIATNAVQEVSVSTGTFSAEYGNALSGVVNYVTKEGGRRFTGSVRTYTGDYVSSRTSLFTNVDDVDPFNASRVELTLGGPVPAFGKNLSFYSSGVYQRQRGYLYGVRLYNPWDSHLSRVSFPSADPRAGSSDEPYYFGPLNHASSDAVGGSSGDGALVAMNTNRSYNLQLNLAYRFSPTLKLKYEVVFDDEVDQDYSKAFKFNPDGRPTTYLDGIVHSVDLTHTLSERMFYTVKGSYAVNHGNEYTYEDPTDPRYLPSFYLQLLGDAGYYTGGVNLGRFSRRTKTAALKFDMVAQVSDQHELKAGVEFRRHELKLSSYTIYFIDRNTGEIVNDFDDILRRNLQPVPVVQGEFSGLVTYEREPVQLAAYAQTKMEFARSFILNVGLRYEYFDPSASYNPEISGEYTVGAPPFLTKNLKPAEKKHRLSPRISVAYPITDRGVIRLSYGHFYQVPSLSQLYRNPDFKQLSGVTPTFGNPNANPQKSVQYEIGLQQGLTDDLKVDMTGFYKDVRDYIFLQEFRGGKGELSYYELTNLSYANTRGITVSVLKRRSPGSLFSASIDYTFQVAEGNRTEPTDEIFFDLKSGRQTETFLVPLSFDRQHTLNMTLTLSEPGDWTVSSIGRFRTGTPYTPSFPANVVPISFEQNSARQLTQWSVDLQAEKFFSLFGVSSSIFLRVENLFDTQNELFAYDNSGRALYNINEKVNPTQFSDLRRRIQRGDTGLIPETELNTFYEDPSRVSAPRLMRVGLSVVL